MAIGAPDIGAIMSSRAFDLAQTVLEIADEKELRLATAESCTGGLLSTILTEFRGLSRCFECGFIVYSNQSKEKLLGISGKLIAERGAVSRAIALEMARNSLRRCDAHLALAVTGFAGPGGGSDEEGLVYMAVAAIGDLAQHEEHHFGQIGRDGVRRKTLEGALELLARTIVGIPPIHA